MVGSKFAKFLVSALKKQVNSFSNFASFFFVEVHSLSVNFKLIHFLLWIKGSHTSPSSESFKHSGENLPYFSWHFPNRKLVFLKIFHHSSVSSMYYFRSNVIHFAQMRISSAQVKTHQIIAIFKNKKSVSLSNFPSFFSAIRNNPSVLS